MKTINLKIAVIALQLSTTLLGATWAHAQGGGVNGPDLKGSSIPVIAEGEIPLNEFKATVKKCYDEAASALITTMFGRKEGLDVSKLHGSSTDGLQVTTWQNANNEFVPFHIEGYFSDGYSQPAKNPELILGQTDLLQIRPSNPGLSGLVYHLTIGQGKAAHSLQITYGYGDFFGKGEGRSLSWSVLGTPELYGKIVDRSQYSEAGEILSSRQYIQNAHFENFSSQYSLDHLPIEASNYLHGVKENDQQVVPYRIKLTFDFTAVQACLKSEVAKISR